MVHASAVAPVSFLKDALKSIFGLGGATSVSFLIVKLSGSYDHLAVIYVLAVELHSRLSVGNLAAITGVAGTNYYITYLCHAFNFTISGYPVTFISLLAVSIVTTTMTAQIKSRHTFPYSAKGRPGAFLTECPPDSARQQGNYPPQNRAEPGRAKIIILTEVGVGYRMCDEP